jgi:hypothetical protein
MGKYRTMCRGYRLKLSDFGKTVNEVLHPYFLMDM